MVAAACKSHSFHINTSHRQIKLSKNTKLVLTIDSGTEIPSNLLDGRSNQITDTSTNEDVKNFNADEADPIFGPVHINDAEAGDVLEMEVLDLTCASYGWTAMLKGFGVLADEFVEPYLKIWDLTWKEGYAVLKEGVHIPLQPFLGVVGVAPAEEGELSTILPLDAGGHIGCKYIVQGSTLYLLVKLAGALLSCGDGHAAQGRGRECS